MILVLRNIFCVLIFLPILSQATCGITYELNGGRFGDNIQNYAKAKYLAYKYGLTFFYQSFVYSDLLQLSLFENRNDSSEVEVFDQSTKIKTEEDIRSANDFTFFVTNFYNSLEINNLYDYCYEHYDFKLELQKMLQPICKIRLIDLPTDRITIAIHARKGSGGDGYVSCKQIYDDNHYEIEHQISELIGYLEPTSTYSYSRLDYMYPDKFLPDQYYIRQIIKISELFNDAPIYVHIFTDARSPRRVIHAYKCKIKKNNIVFGCTSREYKGNYVIDDYYNMSRFDCLIRSNSFFPQAAQLLGNHALVVYPRHVFVDSDRIVADKVGILVNKTSLAILNARLGINK